MLKVVAKFIVQDDKVEEFIEKTDILIEKTRQEKGNIAYELYQDVDDPQTLSFIEEWKNEQVLKEHMQTDHFKETVPELENLLVPEMDKPEANVYKLVE